MTPPAQPIFNLDSIFRPREIVLPEQRVSPFSGHELSMRDGFWMRRVMSTDDLWIFFTLVLVTVFLLLFLRTRRVKVGLLFRSCVSQRKLDMLIRVCNFSRLSLVLQVTIYFSLLAVIPLYRFLADNVGVSLTDIPAVDYLLMVVALWLACLLRQVVTLMLGNAFWDGDAIRLYINNTQIFLLVDSLVLLPLVTLVCFSPFTAGASIVAVCLMALLLLMRIFRGMAIILGTARNSKFYFFSYLCIVEIVPLLIIAKLAIG